MGLKGIRCSKCGRKSWKRVFDLDLSMYVCQNQNCGNPQFHVAVCGSSLLDIVKHYHSGNTPYGDHDAALLLKGIQLIETQMGKLILKELMADKKPLGSS